MQDGLEKRVKANETDPRGLALNGSRLRGNHLVQFCYGRRRIDGAASPETLHATRWTGCVPRRACIVDVSSFSTGGVVECGRREVRVAECVLVYM
jgi:hypothetical protein